MLRTTKILIVDPNAAASANARRFLLSRYDDIFVARGVAEALRIAAATAPDVVILDSELTAPYTMHQLSHVILPKTEVILAGARADAAEKMLFVAIEDVRISGVVQKPYDRDELLEVVGLLTAPGDEDPTVDSLPALQTIEDEPAVTHVARRLAERLESELPGLVEDPEHRRLIARICALALEIEVEATEHATVEELPHELPTTGEVALEGRIGPIPVEYVFQLAENMSGRISVSFEKDGQRIDLFFFERHLVHATGPVFGVQAIVTEALGWTGAEFVIRRDVSFPETFEEALPVPFVLLEGMRLLDERARGDSEP